jgi:hypothetical protein
MVTVFSMVFSTVTVLSAAGAVTVLSTVLAGAAWLPARYPPTPATTTATPRPADTAVSLLIAALLLMGFPPAIFSESSFDLLDNAFLLTIGRS